MYVIIITGNKKFINTPLAQEYYKSIEQYLRNKGVGKVEFDAGEDYTCPQSDADFYIGHSRGVSRFICMETKEQQRRFLCFGVPGGVIHPVDLKWQQQCSLPVKDFPPKEHFYFIKEQKSAIDDMINYINNKSREI